MRINRFILILAVFILVLVACGSKDESDSPEETKTGEGTEEQTEEQTVIDEDAVDKSDTVSKDEEIEEELLNEEGVTGANLLITEDAGGFIIVDFNVGDEMEEAEARELAEKYANKIKEKYKDTSVDVQARKSGETFVQVTLD